MVGLPMSWLWKTGAVYSETTCAPSWTIILPWNGLVMEEQKGLLFVILQPIQ
jgi:hypothetical protein